MSATCTNDTGLSSKEIVDIST
eukprot:SAG31_NODE_19657_length_595_cov_0.975806_1_plen_21_part_10